MSSQRRFATFCSLLASTLVVGQHSDPARAEPESSDETTQVMEEVIVRGNRSLSRLRLELDAARERAYDTFNRINSDDEFNVKCGRESRNGMLVPQFRCTPQFVSDVTREAVAGFRHTYLSPAQGTRGMMEYLSYMSPVAAKYRMLNDEIMRLAGENEEFRESILDWSRLQSEYEEARRQRFGE